MNHFNLPRAIHAVSASLFGAALLATIAMAQSIKVEGLIKARNGDTMILRTSNSPNLVVLLTDDTQVGQVQGVLKARKKEKTPGEWAKELDGTNIENSQALLARYWLRVASDVVAFRPMVKLAGSVVSPDFWLRAKVAPAKVTPRGPSDSVPLAPPLISRSRIGALRIE